MFVVTTQVLENYGAHSEDGKFASGNAYWKMKGGNGYLVKDIDRAQDAMAFVMAAFSENEIGYKEFPVAVESVDEWKFNNLPDDEEYREFLMSQMLVVSPKTGREFTKGFVS
jgi:hypothetical protein